MKGLLRWVATVPLRRSAFEWLRIIGRAVVRTRVWFFGFRRSRRGPSVICEGAPQAEFGPNHGVGSYDCKVKDATVGLCVSFAEKSHKHSGWSVSAWRGTILSSGVTTETAIAG